MTAQVIEFPKAHEKTPGCCWFDDPEEVTDFATEVMAELFWGLKEKVGVVVGFFREPWDHDELHGVWVVKGAPGLGDDGWVEFVETAEELGVLG